MTSTVSIFYLACFFLLTLQFRLSLGISIGSQHEKILANETANFMCSNITISKLKSCQFNVWLSDMNHDTGLIRNRDLKEWHKVPNRNVTARSYNTDTSKGQCGMTLARLSNGRYVVGCRVRVEGGNWVYNYMTLHVQDRKGIPRKALSLNQMDNIFVSRGEDIHATCSSNESMKQCHFNIPRKSVWVNVGQGSDHGEIYYDKIDDKGCRIQAVNATYEDAGVLWCKGEFDSSKFREIRGTAIIIKSPPAQPPVIKTSKTKFNVGDTLEANCSVGESVPQANITWRLNGKVVDDVEEVVDDSRWRWIWEAVGRTQMLKINLTDEHVGEDVKLDCIATHVVTNKTDSITLVIEGKTTSTAKPTKTTPKTSTRTPTTPTTPPTTTTRPTTPTTTTTTTRPTTTTSPTTTTTSRATIKQTTTSKPVTIPHTTSSPTTATRKATITSSPRTSQAPRTSATTADTTSQSTPSSQGTSSPPTQSSRSLDSNDVTLYSAVGGAVAGFLLIALVVFLTVARVKRRCCFREHSGPADTVAVIFTNTSKRSSINSVTPDTSNYWLSEDKVVYASVKKPAPSQPPRSSAGRSEDVVDDKVLYAAIQHPGPAEPPRSSAGRSEDVVDDKVQYAELSFNK